MLTLGMGWGAWGGGWACGPPGSTHRRAEAVVARAPGVIGDGTHRSHNGGDVAVTTARVQCAALSEADETTRGRGPLAAYGEGGAVLHVMMVDGRAVALRGDSKVCAAGVERGDEPRRVVLPFAEYGHAIDADGHLRRMPVLFPVETAEALVEVIVPRVTPTLVQQAEVLLALDARQCHIALQRDHLLCRASVDPSRHVPQGSRAAAQPLQDEVLCAAKPCLKWAIHILGDCEVLTAPSVHPDRRSQRHIAKERCSAWRRVAAAAAANTTAWACTSIGWHLVRLLPAGTENEFSTVRTQRGTVGAWRERIGRGIAVTTHWRGAVTTLPWVFTIVAVATSRRGVATPRRIGAASRLVILAS